MLWRGCLLRVVLLLAASKLYSLAQVFGCLLDGRFGRYGGDAVVWSVMGAWTARMNVAGRCSLLWLLLIHLVL